MQERGDRDALQAEHDEHVRRREDALVAAVVDVVADVPVHAEHGDLEREAAEEGGDGVAGGHPGEPFGALEHGRDRAGHGRSSIPY